MRTLAEGLAAVHDYTLVYETDFSRFADRPPLSDEERAFAPADPALRARLAAIIAEIGNVSPAVAALGWKLHECRVIGPP